ncbi:MULTISPECIES: ABC transporter substrate-binding protein [Brenneria]|nr:MULTISPECIES: ABC transporter substrate-binding protein [Brenneria]EHD20054.1 ABC-type transporter, periplasmic subunit [Brenneria sp. EniD312]QCR03293.1 ABC transporter substrate-binding protein [Brenneria nigrifluens DSM 30175 = ATCC 13028]
MPASAVLSTGPFRAIKKLAVIAFSLFLLAGCDSADTSGGASPSTIRYALWSSPSGNFHPELYFTDYDRAVIFVAFDRLVELSPQQEFTPSLASRYEYSPDGRTLTFHLRDGVKWHDGQPFTARDVAFTYQATADAHWPADTPEFTTQLEGFKAYHEGNADAVSGIKVIDDRTVSFTFTTPYASALSYFADRPVLAKHIWEKTPIAEWSRATALLNSPVGTGPYKVTRFVPDQYVELARNDDYFKGAPKTERLIFKVSNRDTAQSELINGELDIVELSSFNPTDLKLYQDAGVNLIVQNGTSGQYISVNHQDPILADTRVRQALIYGINRQGIIDHLLFGNGQLFNAKIHPQDPAYPPQLNEYPYSADKAAALLEQAGWVAGGDGFRVKDGKRLALTLHVPTGNRTREQSAAIIQQDLKQIGIDINIIVGDFNSTLAILQNPQTPYQLLLMGGMFRPGQYSNDYWWERFSDEQLTQLGDEANRTVENGARNQLLHQWAQRQNELAILTWLYIPSLGYAVNPRISQYQPYAYEAFSQVNQWTIAP